MSWKRGVTCRTHDLREQRASWREQRGSWREQKALWREQRRAGEADAVVQSGPPNGFALLPWLLMGLGAFSHLLQGKTPNPWIGGIGLFVFNSLYIGVAFRAFDKRARESRATLVALLAMGALTVGLAAGYGGNWLMYFPLYGLAVGAVVRGRHLGPIGLGLSALAGAVAGLREGWDGINIAYGTFLSTMVTAAILSLSEAVRDLRAAREELARRAVAEERLRFSRDLHDLLGHTLSLIVVKSEAARRLAPRDMDAALSQITDIESVGRQALTEIREAVTGYRDAALAAELDRARELLDAAGVEAVVRQSGRPLDPRSEALLGWVVREAATNVVRHARARRCEIEVAATSEQTRLTITDDGRGLGSTTPGSGLKGLAERLTAAGGALESGPEPRGGFRVTAVLPVAEGGDAGDATDVTDAEPVRAGTHEERTP
ncbi:sensor histidine kinase [Streptomyces flavofungini]|uniref:Sensor histidine kinase n=1 Tax=Streptomyces flavofungini TaxID=68200 RepID=A0ABS0XIH7_9ACTN|nr:sensor histidine kinase [Streptomyces flavofungini]MBJ3813029.1 sensor histidine kinase [Streptomyces flavofungini]